MNKPLVVSALVVAAGGFWKFQQRRIEMKSPPPGMLGTWEGPCAPNPANQGIPQQIFAKFTREGNETLYLVDYGDPTCQTPISWMRVTGRFAMFRHGSSKTFEKETRYSQTHVILLDKRILRPANEAKLFGRSNWKIGAIWDVTGMPRSPGGKPVFVAGTTLVDKVEADGKVMRVGRATGGAAALSVPHFSSIDALPSYLN